MSKIPLTEEEAQILIFEGDLEGWVTVEYSDYIDNGKSSNATIILSNSESTWEIPFSRHGDPSYGYETVIHIDDSFEVEKKEVTVTKWVKKK